MREIGVVLPNGIAPVDGATILEWARRADAGPFSSVAMPDRLTYPNLEPLVTLGAVAGVTSRVRLVTQIVLGPLRSAPILAKQIATLAQFAPGRLTIGIGVGARRNDYKELGYDWKTRDDTLDEQLAYMQKLRVPEDEQAIGPRLPDDVEFLMGGARNRAIGRLLQFGHGYISGGIKHEFFNYEVMATRGAWEAAGKPGKPRIVAGGWYASDARADEANANLARYWVQGGPPDMIRMEPAVGRRAVIEAADAFFELGADEVIFFPAVSEVSELEWLAEVVPDIS